jgi:hypothetical protein
MSAFEIWLIDACLHWIKTFLMRIQIRCWSDLKIWNVLALQEFAPCEGRDCRVADHSKRIRILVGFTASIGLEHYLLFPRINSTVCHCHCDADLNLDWICILAEALLTLQDFQAHKSVVNPDRRAIMC